MAAHVIASAGVPVRLYERRRGAGHKLLIAGASGLNITYDGPPHYTPWERMRPFVESFPPSAWVRFVEDLGVKTFRGTSRRWIGEGLKAPPLLHRWLSRLADLGVTVEYGRELAGFGPGVELRFADGSSVDCAAAVIALGGGSWEKSPVTWPAFFREAGVAVEDLHPSNIGFHVDWPAAFLAEAEGKPIKNVTVRSSRGTRAGDLVVTAYGLEGTPIYFVGEVGTVHLDLKPDLTVEQVRKRLEGRGENLSPIRRVKRFLKLSEAALALVFHCGTLPGSLDALATHLKSLPLTLTGTQPLEEAISSAGGVAWSELDEALMLKRIPGVYVAGEMIDWDAPTGGYLIQGCVSQGHAVGQAVLESLISAPKDPGLAPRGPGLP